VLLPILLLNNAWFSSAASFPELASREGPRFLVFVQDKASSGDFDVERLDDFAEGPALFKHLFHKQHALLRSANTYFDGDSRILSLTVCVLYILLRHLLFYYKVTTNKRALNASRAPSNTFSKPLKPTQLVG